MREMTGKRYGHWSFADRIVLPGVRPTDIHAAYQRVDSIDRGSHIKASSAETEYRLQLISEICAIMSGAT